MSEIHNRWVERLSPDDRARYNLALETGICWKPDCLRQAVPFISLPAYQCATCGLEQLARGIETPWEGDSIKEISDGEQLGALIRDRAGLPKTQ